MDQVLVAPSAIRRRANFLLQPLLSDGPQTRVHSEILPPFFRLLRTP
jgi:hypothetical protein